MIIPWYKMNIYKIILVVSFIIYTVSWSFITILRFLSFNAGVFDLGVSSYLLYSLFHQPFRIFYDGQPSLALNKMIYFLIAPFFNLFPNDEMLLVFQSTIIGASVFPLFGIAKHFTHDDRTSLFISLTFLFYYPIGGVNWFDFHFMALVPFFFLTGFYFYLKGEKRKSFLFLFLAMISDYLVPLIVFIMSILTMREKDNRKFSIILMTVSAALFMTVTLYFGISYFTVLANYHSIQSYITVITTTWQEKVLYIIYMLAPLLFIPFLDRRYIFLILPFMGFAFLNNYFPYISPMFFQYPSLIAPFLFISLSRGIVPLSKIFRKNNIRALRNIALLVIAVNISISLVLMPWGPLNAYIVPSYDIQENTHFTGYDAQLENIIKLIPRGSSIMIQDNMPQLCIGYNWMLPDSWHRGIYPEYVIEDPYSFFLTHPSLYTTPQNLTMINVFNYLYMTGRYGIVADASGIILLKRNYTGPMEYYVPYYGNFSPDSMMLNNGSRSRNIISVNNDFTRSGQWNQIWGGPFINLAPGYYRAIFRIMTTNNSSSNSIVLVVSYHLNSSVVSINSTVLNGSGLKINTWENISIYFRINVIDSGVEFRGDSPQWNGTLLFGGVTVQQLSPPEVNYV